MLSNFEKFLCTLVLSFFYLCATSVNQTLTEKFPTGPKIVVLPGGSSLWSFAHPLFCSFSGLHLRQTLEELREEAEEGDSRTPTHLDAGVGWASP